MQAAEKPANGASLTPLPRSAARAPSWGPLSTHPLTGPARAMGQIEGVPAQHTTSGIGFQQFLPEISQDTGGLITAP